MKKIVILSLLIAVAAMGNAQVKLNTSKTVKQTPVQQTTTAPVNAPTTTSAPVNTTITVQPNLTEGKDLKITIDRIDDKSTFNMNKYTVNYTITNCGTENLNLSYFQVNGTFYDPQNGYKCCDDIVTSSSLQNNNPWLLSGQSIKGVRDITAPVLRPDVSYKYVLKIDGGNRIKEDRVNNNTSESSVYARAIRDADFYLASVKVTIQTGNDNKEANNSLVYFYLGPANANEATYFNIGEWVKGTGYANEIKANSTTEIVLPRKLLDSERNTLCFYKQKGVALTIIYDNKVFKSDAWKINNISITLQFKDKNGNLYPHPSFASKTISFPNSSGLLGYKFGDDILNNANQVRMITVGTDQNFNPLPPVFKSLGSNNNFNTLVLENSPTYNKPVKTCY